MSRKFNIGRQSEHILNKEMYDMFMSMKYLNSGNTAPTKDEQSDIPNGALWLEKYFNKSLLNTYNEASNTWDPVFKGHYHPADVFTKPANPVNGQLWIDHSNGDLLHYYDINTNSWIAVSALTLEKDDSNIGAYNDFIIINPLVASLENSYLVPNEVSGKLYDGKNYIHPSDSNYTKVSSVVVDYISKYPQEESWIHINQKRLSNIEKRLFKVNTNPLDQDAYMVEMSNTQNTEFYGIDKTTGIGKLLLSDYSDYDNSDYTYTENGIKLLNTNYEYIYAISYSFIAYNTRAGQITRNSGQIGTQDTVYVGPCTEHAFVFLEGLYLEQDKYTHDKNSNSVTITGDNITQLMDMTVVTFPDFSKQSDNETPLEFTINQTNGTLRVYSMDSNNAKTFSRDSVSYALESTDAVVGPLTNAKDFKKPMAFVCGVHSDIMAEPKDVIIENDLAIIKNIGPMEDLDKFKVMIVEADGVYVGCGTVDKDKTIRHNDITVNDEYMLYVEGILVSPRDLDISEGEIRVLGLQPNQNWTLLKINESNNTSIVFDSPISHYSIKIEDNNEATVYNNCDSVVLYAGSGILVDRDSIVKDALPLKGKNGEIIVKNITNENELLSENYSSKRYCQWSSELAKWIDITDTKIIQEIDIIKDGYISNKGSISILNKNTINMPYTYYAYTFINSIDEPLLFGTRETKEGSLDYKVNLKHDFIPNTGSLIAYLNGLRIYPKENKNGVFTLNEIDSISTTTWDDKNVLDIFKNKDNALDDAVLSYIIERPENDETISYEKVTLTPADRVYGHINTYKSEMPLTPGYVTAFVNGIRLPREEFSILNENTIIFYRDIIGGQAINVIDNPSTWNKHAIHSASEIKEIECISHDVITLEIRKDYTIKEITLPVRYAGQTRFSVDDDGLPRSILSSKDFVKVYINGIFYGKNINIYEKDGYIDLKDESIKYPDEDPIINLGVDPIDKFFKENPSEHEKYKEKYKKDYIAKRPKDYITIEWR